MNIYPQQMYSEVIEYDAAYNYQDAYQQRKFKKNQRRDQRRRKQQRREAYWDSF